MRDQSQPVVHRYAPLPAIEALSQAEHSQSGNLGSALQWPWRRLTGSSGGKKWVIVLMTMIVLVFTLVSSNPGEPLILASNTHSPGYREMLKKVLNHQRPPTRLRDQLADNVQYITGMYFGGQANQLLAIINLLYIAKYTGRVAILPQFTALHFGGSKRRVDFAYDLAQLYDETRVLALPLPALKRSRTRTYTPPMEPLPCWSTMEIRTSSSNYHPPSSPEENGLWAHGLEPSFWAVPWLPWTKNNYAIRLSAVIDFARNTTWQHEYLERAKQEFLPQKRIPDGVDVAKIDRASNIKQTFDPFGDFPPTVDEQLMCLDATYFMGEDPPPPPHPQNQPLEFLRTDAWYEIGQHMHFNKEVELLADLTLRKIFGVAALAAVPPFITVHIRRGDFHGFKGYKYTPLSHYADALAEVRTRIDEVLATQGSRPSAETSMDDGKPSQPRLKRFPGLTAADYKVLVATDEDPTSPFRQEIADMGWYAIDHNKLRTKKLYGDWYLPLLDGELLSRGQGFVGTTWSTFSLLAGQRVESWRGGPHVLARPQPQDG